MTKCEHIFVKSGFVMRKAGRKQRYQCNKCGKVSVIKQTLSERFWKKVDKTKSECWIWTGSKDRYGYGRATISHNETELAHRLVYKMSIGEIPKHLQVDHLCRNRLCVNPAHLELVTLQENLARGRLARGKQQ